MKKISGKLGTFVGKKKIVLGYIGAVFIVLLFVSSACGAPVLQTSQTDHSLKSEGMNTKREVTVDPNICITKEKLPLLKIALQYVDNPDVKKLIRAIINEIKRDGMATTRGIEQIENNLGIFFPIYTGRINNWGAGDSFCFPGNFFGQILFFRWGPALVVAWNCTGGDWGQNGYTRINFIHSYNPPNSGFIIGFLGLVGFPYPTSWDEKVFGTCVLIIVTEGTPV